MPARKQHNVEAVQANKKKERNISYTLQEHKNQDEEREKKVR
jgi:hypothetical protein